MRGKFGQFFNFRGVLSTAHVLLGNRRLAVPNERVRCVSDIDFARLRGQGFTHVVFDKDNTLTLPYSDVVHATAQAGLDAALRTFGSANVIVFSNSAGSPDDEDHREAKALERKWGVQVLRHTHRKPAGGDDLKKLMCGAADKAVVVGDRLLTDIVFGKANGHYAILVDPIDATKDNVSVKAARWLERRMV